VVAPLRPAAKEMCGALSHASTALKEKSIDLLVRVGLASSFHQRQHVAKKLELWHDNRHILHTLTSVFLQSGTSTGAPATKIETLLKGGGNCSDGRLVCQEQQALFERGATWFPKRQRNSSGCMSKNCEAMVDPASTCQRFCVAGS